MKKNILNLNLLLQSILVLTFAGCSVHAGTGSSADDQAGVTDADSSLSYDFKVNNFCEGMCTDPESNEKCETAHSFDSKADYCSGLEDVSLNKGCARADRLDRYTQDCGSDFHDINS